jgi:hypothetical protein
VSDGEQGQEPVGTIGEEAAKLLQALQDWAKESGGDYAGATSEAVSGAASTLRDINEHIATGSDDCRYCPICQAISLVRSTSPEVRQHLSSAASSLLQAAAGLLATPVPSPDAKRNGPVERIDLDDGIDDCIDDGIDDGDWED